MYVVSPPGPDRERVIARLGEPVKAVYDSVDAFLAGTKVIPADPTQPPGPLGEAPLFPPPRSGLRPGSLGETHVVVLGADLPSDETLKLARAVAERDETWVPIVLEADGTHDGPVARPLSVGFPLLLDELLDRVDQAERPLLELRTVLRFISRARHDLNNPLTSGLAETQLLLMDVEEGEIRESLEVIQDQLRRIRDLVASLSVLKQPTN